MPFLREHSEALGTVHAEVRAHLRGPIGAAEQLFRSFTERAGEAFNGDVRVLSAIRYRDDGTFEESERLTSAYSERRKELEVKNHDIGNIGNRFVSSE
jgi:hypothetical protein